MEIRMKEKQSQEDNIETLVKYGQIDLVAKFVLITMAGIGGYFGYLYATKKQEEITAMIDQYKKKVSSVPIFGKMFFG